VVCEASDLGLVWKDRGWKGLRCVIVCEGAKVEGSEKGLVSDDNVVALKRRMGKHGRL
jgi:hypothetical protein